MATKNCLYPSCIASITDGSYCEKHMTKREYKPREIAEHNKTANGKQFYMTKAWVKLRNAYRKEHPFCEHCLKYGRYTLIGQTRDGSVVDHIVEIYDDWDKRLDYDNLQSLCAMHHNMKTQDEKRKRNKKNVVSAHSLRPKRKI